MFQSGEIPWPIRVVFELQKDSFERYEIIDSENFITYIERIHIQSVEYLDGDTVVRPLAEMYTTLCSAKKQNLASQWKEKTIEGEREFDTTL